MGMAEPRHKPIRQKRRVKSIKVRHPRPIPHPRSRKRRAQSFFRGMTLLSLCIFAFCLSGLLLMRYTQITQINNTNASIKANISELKATRDVLVSRLEPYKSTQRIEHLAKTNLGMHYPGKDDVLEVDLTTLPLENTEKSKYAIINGIQSIVSVGYHGD